MFASAEVAVLNFTRTTNAGRRKPGNQLESSSEARLIRSVGLV
jgi:hypothetical protein